MALTSQDPSSLEEKERHTVDPEGVPSCKTAASPHQEWRAGLFLSYPQLKAQVKGQVPPR